MNLNRCDADFMPLSLIVVASHLKTRVRYWFSILFTMNFKVFLAPDKIFMVFLAPDLIFHGFPSPRLDFLFFLFNSSRGFFWCVDFFGVF